MAEAKIDGYYRHYKTNDIYRVIGFAQHSESEDNLVLYQRCDVHGRNGCEGHKTWARPRAMFEENVYPKDLVHAGDPAVPRFAYLGMRHPVIEEAVNRVLAAIKTLPAKLPDDWFDDNIYDAVDETAPEINNAGFERQIEFMLYGRDDVEKATAELIEAMRKEFA